jgi:hypothetical protein
MAEFTHNRYTVYVYVYTHYNKGHREVFTGTGQGQLRFEMLNALALSNNELKMLQNRYDKYSDKFSSIFITTHFSYLFSHWNTSTQYILLSGLTGIGSKKVLIVVIALLSDRKHP